MPNTSQYELPLFPLNVVLYPGMQFPIRVFEDRYKLMVKKCLESDQSFGVVLIKSGKEVGGSAVPYDVGTVAKITGVVPEEEGCMTLSVCGERVFRILKIQRITPYMIAKVSVFSPAVDSNEKLLNLSSRVSQHFRTYISLLASLKGVDVPKFELDDDPQRLSYMVASGMVVSEQKKQGLLEASSLEDRLQEEMRLLKTENLSLELFLSQKKNTKAPDGARGRGIGDQRFSPN